MSGLLKAAEQLAIGRPAIVVARLDLRVSLAQSGRQQFERAADLAGPCPFSISLEVRIWRNDLGKSGPSTASGLGYARPGPLSPPATVAGHQI